MLNLYSWEETPEGYEFTTIQNLDFLVYFTDFYLEDPKTSEHIHVYSIGVVCKQGNEFNINRKDGLIQQTVTAIILDFFDKNSDQAVLYTCLGDGNERERRITFGRWYHELGNNIFEKHDCDKNYTNRGLYASIILRTDNVNKENFINSFHHTIKTWFE